jgi:ribosome recycling factor
MVDQMVGAAKPKMQAALEHFLNELKTVRTGRASATMVEHVMVSYYGTMTPLKALATLTVPEATQITIQPFDQAAVRDIVNPTDDGRTVRVQIPPLTAERREEMVKMVNKMSEEARIVIRQIRGKVWDDIQKGRKDSTLTEENLTWGRDEIDKITAEFNKKIEDGVKEKEVEIRTV